MPDIENDTETVCNVFQCDLVDRLRSKCIVATGVAVGNLSPSGSADLQSRTDTVAIVVAESAVETKQSLLDLHAVEIDDRNDLMRRQVDPFRASLRDKLPLDRLHQVSLSFLASFPADLSSQLLLLQLAS